MKTIDTPHNDNDSSADSPSNSGDSIAKKLENAIRNNLFDDVKRALDSRDDLVEMLLEYEFTQYCKTETLKVTPLALASVFSELSIVNFLLDRNATVDQTGPPLFLTPLHFASINGRKDIVARILEARADPSLQDNDGNTAFHHASQYGHLETLQILYQQGSREHINQANKRHNAPLHLASGYDHPETAKWLLDSGAAINQAGESAATPLSLACGGGCVNTVRMLLDRGADIHKRNNYSFTPILLVCLNPHLEIFKMLRDQGALISDVTSNKDTCFHQIIDSSQGFTNDSKEIINGLIGGGGNINQPNIHGCPPLHSACRQEKLKFVEYLIRLGADVNQVRSQGNITALMEACCQQDSRITKVLLQYNADTTIANNHGVTALTLAVFFDHLENVKLLIKNGANAVVHAKDGSTPVQVAIKEKGNVKTAIEVLAAKEYYPQNPSQKFHYMERAADVPEIEAGLLKGFESGKYETLEQLYILMYWAISNGALELATKCIDHNEQVLQWIREGATWLHIASKSGTLKVTQLLLDRMTNQQDQPDRPDELAKVEFILQQNSLGDSPLTICIDRGHHQLEEEYWSKIRQLHTSGNSFVESYPAVVDRILELLATYEKPGHETILGEFLHKEGVQNSKHFTTLHWAVYGSQAVVVWWLLSKNGYSSDDVKSALKLVPDTRVSRDIRSLVRKLLENPPPALDRVANPNKNHIHRSSKHVDKIDELGSIVDIISGGQTIKIPYDKASVYDIIYGKGPESIMKKARKDLRQRDLDSLKKALGQTRLEQDRRSYASCSGGTAAQCSSSLRPVESTSSEHDKYDNEESSGDTPRDLRLRWIHLPVNQLHLMQDLVSRLSHDSKRSETEYMAIMKHFNRSWTALAAGAGRYYMKPQFVRKQENDTQNLAGDSGGNQVPRKSNTGFCTALYMPYLTIGTYISGEDKSATTANHLDSDKSTKERNSREVIHEPITLDQYYYPTIANTSARDNDQVLSKFLQSKRKQHEGVKQLGTMTKKKILIVNQLWIWIIDEKTIITATSEKFNQNSSQSIQLDPKSSGGLLQTALNNILNGEAKGRFERATTAHSVMELLLGAATGSFMDPSVEIFNEKSKGPIEIFRESIRDVADKENSLFRDFLRGLHEAEKKKGQLPDEEVDPNSPATRPASLNRYHVISSETELLDMIRDIRDELHMLSSLAEDQEFVWKQAFATNNLMNLNFYTPTDIKKDLKNMLSEADKTENYINNLLDLRQAEFGRLQAYDSAKQSNIIFIFTIITIIFLPLSFLTSLFALDVSDFPHESGSVKYKAWWLFPILLGATALVSIPTIILAWNVNALSGKFRPRNNIASESSETSTRAQNAKRGLRDLRRRARKQDKHAV
ncbi:4cecb410-8850-4ae9-86e2-1cd6439bea72 [Sclerotinia trifoliorum]|uniref:4cecb410-8850-4ae9-86e2-1cd6439bea72 n=1 Tax=Sclerotinia trifoliorum TaxID=28548 RepID=A0A8H2VQM0_9HELO|nr:4cecb410-8850-4ae9-86e2-1cd6439bea72 [Sclerotinia trifoliorum]